MHTILRDDGQTLKMGSPDAYVASLEFASEGAVLKCGKKGIELHEVVAMIGSHFIQNAKAFDKLSLGL